MVDDAARERVRRAIVALEEEYGESVSEDLTTLRSLLLDVLPSDRGAIEEATTLGYYLPPPRPDIDRNTDPVLDPDTDPDVGPATDPDTNPVMDPGAEMGGGPAREYLHPEPGPGPRRVWPVVAVAVSLIAGLVAGVFWISGVITDPAPETEDAAVRTPGADPEETTSTPGGLETPTPIPSADPSRLAPPLGGDLAPAPVRLNRVFAVTTMKNRWNCKVEGSIGPGAVHTQYCVWKKNPSIYAFFTVHESVAAAAATRTRLKSEAAQAGTRVNQTKWRLLQPERPGGPLLQFTHFKSNAPRKLGDYTYRGFYARAPYSWTLMGPNADAVNDMFSDGSRFPLLPASQVAAAVQGPTG